MTGEIAARNPNDATATCPYATRTDETGPEIAAITGKGAGTIAGMTVGMTAGLIIVAALDLHKDLDPLTLDNADREAHTMATATHRAVGMRLSVDAAETHLSTDEDEIAGLNALHLPHHLDDLVPRLAAVHDLRRRAAERILRDVETDNVSVRGPDLGLPDETPIALDNVRIETDLPRQRKPVDRTREADRVAEVAPQVDRLRRAVPGAIPRQEAEAAAGVAAMVEEAGARRRRRQRDDRPAEIHQPAEPTAPLRHRRLPGLNACVAALGVNIGN